VLHSLDHVILATLDLEAAESVWARLLGRGRSWRGEHPGAGTANVLFRLENTTLELLAPQGEGRLGAWLRIHLEKRGEGLLGAAFGTADADACAAGWREAGLHPAPVEEGRGRDAHSGVSRAWRSVGLPAGDTRGAVVSAIQHLSPLNALPLAPASGEGVACAHALDHVVLRTREPEAALRLYGERLGLRLALDRVFPKWGVRLLFFRVGGLTWEVASQLEVADADAPDRLWGLSFRVADVAAARARLLEDGFEVSELRPGRKPGTRVLTVVAPTCSVPTLLLEAAP